MYSGEINLVQSDEAKILLILTGGTICSFGDEAGLQRNVHIQKAQTLLLHYFEKSNSFCAGQKFETVSVLNTLSENMTIAKWNSLLDFLKTLDPGRYKGMVIAHGTDTLAYTSSLLAIALSEWNIPVFLVSSQLPLDQEGANGNENFRRCVELICSGIQPGVYVVYRNSDGKCFLHHGGHLVSCGDYSNDFYSKDAICLNIDNLSAALDISSKKKDNSNDTMWLSQQHICCQRNGSRIQLQNIGSLKSDVLQIEPYVGLDYQRIPLGEEREIRAVVHGLYHSATACIGATKEEQQENCSLLSFLERCKKKNIPVIVTPCPRDAAYVSGAAMLDAGALPVYGMTKEMVYIKALLAGALGYSKDELYDFLKRDICGEYIIEIL